MADLEKLKVEIAGAVDSALLRSVREGFAAGIAAIDEIETTYLPLLANSEKETEFKKNIKVVRYLATNGHDATVADVLTAYEAIVASELFTDEELLQQARGAFTVCKQKAPEKSTEAASLIANMVKDARLSGKIRVELK